MSGESNLRDHELDRLLKEYEALRSELLQRISKQQEITSFALTVLAGVLVALQFVPDSSSFGEALADNIALLPLVSIILSSFTLMTLEYETNIAHIHKYLDTEWDDRFRHVSGDQAPEEHHSWNTARARWQQHDGWKSLLVGTMAASKYLATMVPNAALVYLILSKTTSSEFWSVQGWAAPISVLLFLVSLAGAAYTSDLYLKMAT